MNKTIYKCPLCQSILFSQKGDAINPFNGYSVYCANNLCMSKEVCGHGKTEKDAFEIVLVKYNCRKNKS
jgi:hypothetical protein